MTADHPNARFLALYYEGVAEAEADNSLDAEARQARVAEIQGQLVATLRPDFVIHTAGNRLAATGGLDLAVAMGRRRSELSGGTFRVIDMQQIVADDDYGVIRGMFAADRGDRSLQFAGMGVWRFEAGLAVEHWEMAPANEFDEFFLSAGPELGEGTAETFWRRT